MGDSPSQGPPAASSQEANSYSANSAFINNNYLGFSAPNANNNQNFVPPAQSNFQNGFQTGFNMNPGFQNNAFGSISLANSSFQTENVSFI